MNTKYTDKTVKALFFKASYLSVKRLYAAVKIYIPVFLEQSLATVVTLLGTMLVSGVSPAAVSGVGLVDSLNFLLMNLLTAIATGVTAIVSQYIGRESLKDASLAAASSISLSIYVSVFLTVLLVFFREYILNALFGSADRPVLDAANEYLLYTSLSLPLLAVFSVMSGIRRGCGDNFIPLIGSVISNVAYIAVALICINIFDLGVSGVGLGLLASRLFSALTVAVFIFRYPRLIKIKRLPLRMKKETIAPVLNIAMPCGMDTIVFNGGKILVQVFMSGMGTASLAAYTICNSLSNFTQIPGRTFQITSVNLVGYAYGSGDIKKSKRLMLTQTIFASVYEAVSCVMIFVILNPLISIFTNDPEITVFCRQIMYLLIIATPFLWATSFVTPNALRATADAKFTMIVSMVSMVFFRIIGSWYFGVYLSMGVFGIYLSMVVDWLFRSIFYVYRVFSLKWAGRF